MEKKMTFNYFYGTEADQFSFYRIPKALFTDSYFKDLSSDAKILYGLMLDRMSLSIKNQWFDDKNRAYIYFSIEDIMELLNCGRNKAIKSMRELDDETGIGLIEKRRQGFGKVNVIYVKTFMPEKTDEKKFGEELKKFKKQTSVENEESTEVYNSNFMKSQNQTSRSPENKLQEVYISNPNNTNLSDTEMNDNKSNHIISVDEKRFDSDNHSEDYQAYENLVKETIDYESLEVTHHDDMRQVDEIVNLIVETVMCKNDKILIASNWYPASLVKKKFLMLTYSHIEYVLHCMSGNTTKVKNIKKYLFTGYKKAYYTENAFDSDTERLFSIILEEDPDVIRWIKPPLNQLGLFWQAGQQYNPDFLVETTSGKFMVEVKASNEVTADDVVAKAREGIKWCHFASTADPDHKVWEYRLISDDNIKLGNTCKYTLGTAHRVEEG